MADKKYEVLEGQKFAGKHRVYSEGEIFPESELTGNLEMALNGNEKHKIEAKISESKVTKTAKKAGK